MALSNEAFYSSGGEECFGIVQKSGSNQILECVWERTKDNKTIQHIILAALIIVMHLYAKIHLSTETTF